jgi:hypothetical protein
MAKKKMRFGKLPGTYKQRNRARNLLKLEKVADGWKITGGESDHLVVQVGTDLTCDCVIFSRDNKICSHIIKVEMELGIFPTFPILVPVVET